MREAFIIFISPSQENDARAICEAIEGRQYSKGSNCQTIKESIEAEFSVSVTVYTLSEFMLNVNDEYDVISDFISYVYA